MQKVGLAMAAVMARAVVAAARAANEAHPEAAQGAAVAKAPVAKALGAEATEVMGRVEARARAVVRVVRAAMECSA